jgi:putative ABC transport system permease protein
MPDFPGLADAEHCRDWNPGVSIDLDRIRDRDEEYWNTYRGTPKAFVSLTAAQRMWRNRFGALTAIRYPAGTVSPGDISAGIVSDLPPAALGLVVQPVRHQGLLAGSQGVDFGQLFLGLSFFIVIAALLLMGLLFVFSIEYRTRETGVLRALGFTVKQVRRLALCEGSVLAVLGSVIGSIIGIAYTQLILAALRTVWRGAVAAAVFSIHVRPGTVFIGIVSGIIVAIMAMWIALRTHGTRPVSSLLASGMFIAIKGSRRGMIISMCICILSAAGAVLLSISANPRTGKDAAGIFFGAGALLLAAGISITHMFLYYMRGKPSAQLTIRIAGIRNCIRRPGRSLTVAGILACGVFLVVAVAANRQNPLKDPEAASSGTGGFALYGEKTLPILHSLNTAEGRRSFGLTASQLESLSFVYLRVREGDDASCLNLNRVRRPRLLAVDPDEFSKRHSFTFATHTADVDPADPWKALKKPVDNDTIPAVGDLSMIVWGLGKAVGDSIEYTDEYGRMFRIKLVGGLANSIFQGNLIVDRTLFEQRYPSVSGANVILIDAPQDRVDTVQSMLSIAMEDTGLDCIPAAQRLAEFAEVENTYLMIFFALGGLGLLLGSAGLGIIVLRISTERRGEFALLRAVGFTRHTMRSMVIWEHLFLMTDGLVIGTIAALLAVLPAIASPAGDLPWVSLAILVLVICASGWLWIYLAASSAMRADLLVALRNE